MTRFHSDPLSHHIATALREIRDEDGDTIPEVFGERFLMRVAEVAAGVVEEQMRERLR